MFSLSESLSVTIMSLNQCITYYKNFPAQQNCIIKLAIEDSCEKNAQGCCLYKIPTSEKVPYKLIMSGPKFSADIY